MTDDLSILPESVREAVEYCDDIFDDADNGEWAAVRAELLRLAKEDHRSAVIRDSYMVSLTNAQLEMGEAIRRAEKAEAELSKFTRENAECRDNEREAIQRIAQLRDSSERAEDELAKLRQRIDGAPIADADDLSRGVVAVPREWIGKRVRLVEDDE